VFASVYSHVHGFTHLKQVATLVTDFLKETVEAHVLMAGLELRKKQAVQVQAGLSALVRLLGDCGMMELKNDVLCLLANAANPWQHYLSDISASGQHAEDQVRESFHQLIDNLVAVLHVGHSRGRADVVKSVASALTVALDHRDLSHVLSTQLVDWLNNFWASTWHSPPRGRRREEEGRFGGAGASSETASHTCQQLAHNVGVIQAVNRLLVSLLLVLGAHAPSLNVSAPRKILDCAHKAVKALFASEPEFVEWRNHVASLLLLLPADVNRSLQAKPFDQKRVHYAKQNFYAASLDASAYQHQPQFQQFAALHQLPFKAFEAFTKTEQLARRDLVAALVDRVWSPERLQEAAR
jgi:hypothetical protein